MKALSLVHFWLCVMFIEKGIFSLFFSLSLSLFTFVRSRDNQAFFRCYEATCRCKWSNRKWNQFKYHLSSILWLFFCQSEWMNEFFYFIFFFWFAFRSIDQQNRSCVKYHSEQYICICGFDIKSIESETCKCSFSHLFFVRYLADLHETFTRKRIK